jgi:hypothetical protein
LIESINVTTINISEELSRIAKERGVSTSQLYIEIKSTTTFTKDNNTDFIVIPQNDLDTYKEEDIL